MADAHPEFGYMVDVVDSIMASDVRDELAGCTTMHDLLVVPRPIAPPPYDVIRVCSPSSLRAVPDGCVVVEHHAATGNDERIGLPAYEAVHLFWQFVMEKYGIVPASPPLPARIPVQRNEYHTDTIGTYADGQFYLMFRGARTGDPTVDGPFRHAPLRWLVYLHLFDHDGNHRSTTVREISRTSQRLTDTERANGTAETTALLETLDSPVFSDIAIRPFRVDLDGIVFGLINESAPDRGPWAELYPDGFGFAPPWNGEYST